MTGGGVVVVLMSEKPVEAWGFRMRLFGFRRLSS